MSTLGVWLAMSLSVAFGSMTDGIERLVQQERYAQAQQRCERIGGDLSTAEPALREICAHAAWFGAAEEDTVHGWIRYRQVWSGTRFAAPAREQEARVALQVLGEDATPAQIDAFLQRYGDTQAAAEGIFRLADAAIQAAADDPERATQAARRFPDHPGVDALVQRFPERFATVEIHEGQPQITLDPPISLAQPPEAQWVVAFPGEQLLEWEQAAIAHLLDAGLPRPWIDATRRRTDQAFVPCPLPGAPWTLGVLIILGETQRFLPHEGPPSCHGYWPGFAVVSQDRTSALSLAPDLLIELGSGSEPFTRRADGTEIWHVEAAAAPLLTPDALVQSVGASFLFTPLNGDLPWLESTPHATGSLTLSPGILGPMPLPDGWRLQTHGHGTILSSPQNANLAWRLPPGEVRVLSPLLAHHTGLRHPVRPVAAPPPPTDPIAGRRLPVTRLQASDLRAITVRLQADRLGLTLTHAVRLTLRPGSPPLVLFDGEAGDRRVRGVLQPSEGDRWRITAWASEGDPEAGMIFVDQEGQRYATWPGPHGTFETIWAGTQGIRRIIR